MLTRRNFLSRGTTLLALIPVVPAVLQACSSGGGGGGDDTGGPSSCSNGSYTVSSFDDNHSHSVCIPNADLANPPAAGATYTSSDNGAHTHTITLTQADLSMIAAGGTVNVTSTNDNDPIDNKMHTHTFALKKTAASAPPPPPPSGW